MDYEFHWGILWQYRSLLAHGVLVTAQLSFVSIILSLIIGTLFGIGRLSKKLVPKILAGAYIEFFMNTPLVVQLFFWYFALPMIFPQNVQQWLWQHNYEFISAVIGLTIYTSTFIAETVRAGIQSIDKGQTEAAISVGLSGAQTMRYVILPQAMKVILPPLGSQFLNLTKNSSLAMTIAVKELTFQSQAVEAETFRGFEATTGATILYILLTLTITGLVYLIERKMNGPRINNSAPTPARSKSKEKALISSGEVA